MWPQTIAEAQAIDLFPVKVLIFGARPKGPQHLQSSLPRAESIFREADAGKKRAEEKIGKGRKIVSRAHVEAK